MDDGRPDRIAEVRHGRAAEAPSDRIVEAPSTPVAMAPRARVVGLLAEGVSRETLLAAGADVVEAEPAGGGTARDPGGAHRRAPDGHDAADDTGGSVVEDAGEAAAALLAGATVLRTHDPRPVRRAADIIALLRAVRG